MGFCLTSTMRTALGTFGKSKGPVRDEDDDRLRVFKTLLTAAPIMVVF